MALDIRFLYSDAEIAYGESQSSSRPISRLGLRSPLLGTLLWLVAYFLEQSVNFDHKTTLLALLYFGLRLHPNVPHRCLVESFVVLRPYKGKPSKSISQALLHSGLGIKALRLHQTARTPRSYGLSGIYDRRLDPVGFPGPLIYL